MYQNGKEAKVRRKLRDWFGRGKVDQVLPTDNSGCCWQARLTDGGLAYATVEEDGSITIDEREVVC